MQKLKEFLASKQSSKTHADSCSGRNRTLKSKVAASLAMPCSTSNCSFSSAVNAYFSKDGRRDCGSSRKCKSVFNVDAAGQGCISSSEEPHNFTVRSFKACIQQQQLVHSGSSSQYHLAAQGSDNALLELEARSGSEGVGLCSQRPLRSSNIRQWHKGKGYVHPTSDGTSTTNSSGCEHTSATQYEEIDDSWLDLHCGDRNSAEFSCSSRTHPVPPLPPLRLYRERRTFSEELRVLARYCWYWGPISRSEARLRLSDESNGSFLVRDSCSNYHLLSLSYNVNGQTFHTRITFLNGFYSLFQFSSADLFPSVVDLIEYALKVSEHGILCYFTAPSSDNNANDSNSVAERTKVTVSERGVMAGGTGDTIFGYTKYPQFVFGGHRFPQDTFLGRWLHFLDVIDPRTLLVNDEKLNDCIKLLELYSKGALPPATVTDRQLWEAQKIKQAVVHPDTNEKIFMPFRMSGFVPFGSPIVLGLLLPNPTIKATIFWQWLNQSHNACVNYANRNATKATPMSRFVQGYSGAVGTAVSIAVGLSLLLKKAEHFPAATKMIVQKFIPFPAVSLASTCNVILMRRHELGTGIEVTDAEGMVVGTSKVAAKKAVTETAITRAFLPAPIFLIPPICMTFLERTWLLKRYPKLHIAFNAVLCTASFGFALPIAIALFPQKSVISVEKLEPEFSTLTSEKVLFYNKGL